jgi:hypothetical protein
MDRRIGEGDDISTMLRDTSHALVRDFNKNAKVLLCMQRAYIVSQVAVIAMVALLLTDLARR